LTEDISFGRKISIFFMMVGDLGRRERKLFHRISRMTEKIKFAPMYKDIIKTFETIPSGHTVALRPTQSLTEMSTRNISWGVKAAGAQG
jgi:hypothetical protein